MTVEVLVGDPRALPGADLRRRAHADHAAALGSALVALRLAARPARGAMTYGFQRVEVLAAQVNGSTLLVLAAAIVVLGGRAADLPAVGLGVDDGRRGAGGIGSTGLATAALAGGGPGDAMSVEGSFQHLLTDLFAFIGTALAGAVILADGIDSRRPDRSLWSPR